MRARGAGAGAGRVLALLTAIQILASATVRADARAPTVAQADAPELTPQERFIIARHLLAGLDAVHVWIATEPGRANEVAAKLRALSGGSSAAISLLATDVDLLRASVPIARIDELMHWPKVTALAVEDAESLVSSYTTSPEAIPDKRTKRGIPPSAYTPRDNPYTAEVATEALQFKISHPSASGRGVIIGVLEAVDIRTPSLMSALSLRGERISKFADYRLLPPRRVIAEAIPAPDQTDRWQETARVSADENRRVDFGGHTYTVPAEVSRGELRVALVRSRQYEHGGAVPEATILWSVEVLRAWMCEGGETDLSRCLVFALFAAAPQRPVLASTPRSDSRTFLLAVDLPTRALRLLQGAMDHGTLCASVAVGHTFFNSQAEGIAPEAQLLPVVPASWLRDPDSALHKIEAYLALYRDPRIDLLSLSASIMGNGDGRSEDRSVEAHLVKRLAVRYPKLQFQASGNAGPHDTFDEFPKASDSVITIGAYTPPETWRANYGILPSAPHTPPPYSSFGPAYDGALKPDLLGLSETVCAVKEEWPAEWSGPYYELPTGYGLCGGTSSATPSAAGHAALLISAAKQANVPYDPARLKIALFSSAKFLGGVEARVQGHGLIQVADAWDALQKLEHYMPSTFITRAPVRTYYSERLTPAHTGRGLYEQVGWRHGQRGHRDIWITRTSGPAAAVTYGLRWKGDTEAFRSSSKNLALPLNEPVRLPIDVHVGPSHAYSAIVDLIDPTVNLIAHSVMLTIIAAKALDRDNDFTAHLTRQVPRPGHGFVFVDVPPGATALHVRVSASDQTRFTFKARRPDGTEPTEASDLPVDVDRYDQTFSRPLAGVWQLTMTPYNGGWLRYSDYEPMESQRQHSSKFTLEVTALRAESKATVANVPSLGGGVTFTSRQGRLKDARVLPLGLGTLREKNLHLAQRARVFDEIVVPPGTSKLVAETDPEMTTGDSSVSIALFQVGEDARTPVLTVASDLRPGARKSLEVINPKAGRYKVYLEAWGSIPSQGLAIRYRDVLYRTAYGEVSVSSSRPQRSDNRVNAKVTWRIDTATEAGRHVVATVGLFSDRNNRMRLPAGWVKLQAAAITTGKPWPRFTTSIEPVPLATHTWLVR